LYKVQTENIQPNWTLRTELSQKTVQELQTMLKTRAPDFFQSLNQSEQNNPQRLIRKIELLDEGLLENQNSNHSIILPEKLKKIGINTHVEIQLIGLAYQSKDNLHANIESRVEKRIQDGAIQEVEQLLKNGYTEKDPGLRTIGYQQVIAFLKNIMTKEAALQEWLTKEKQYAKRQYTFMKKDQNITWKFI
jgi:tRNA dimethylallyltransferase